MKHFRPPMFAAITLTVILAASPASAQTPTVPPARSDLQDDRVRAMLGMAIENRDGEKLATVKDFILEPELGQIKYAVVSTAGILGLRAQTLAVPLQALSMATVKRHTVALDIGKAKWKNAPRFRKRDLALLEERTREVEIYEFYGLTVPGHKPGRGSGPRPKSPLVFASTLLGKGVISYRDEPLGKVSDLLLDLAGQRPAFVIIAAGDPLRKKQAYAMQLRSLNLSRDDKVVVDASPAMFEQARPLTPKAWQSADSSSARTVYRYQ